MKSTYRNTGRTTRMLEQAIAAAREGKRVVVYGANFAHAGRMLYAAGILAMFMRATTNMAERTLRFAGGGIVSFWVKERGEQRHERERGQQIDLRLTDHYVYERD